MREQWVYLNGNFCLEQQAFIPITDRGFLFGDGIFTTIRVYQGRCEFFEGHLERLCKQAAVLKLDWKAMQFDWISAFIQRNKAWEGIWRLKILITIKENDKVRTIGNLLATLHPYQGSASEPCSLCLFPYPIESPLAHVKSLSYLDHLYVQNFANQQGYADAITRTSEGYLLETGCSNLFWIDQEQCWVPDPQLPYLKGVFLQSLLPHLPWPVQFIKAKMDQVPASASVYICNSLTHVRPVPSIDQANFPRCQQREALLQQATHQALEMTHEKITG